MRDLSHRLLPMLLGVACLAAGCRDRRQPVNRLWNVMGTFATLSVAAQNADDLHKAVYVTRTCFEELNDQWSVYDSASVVSRLNDAAGQAPMTVPPATKQLLALTLHYGKLTEGAFDPTIAPLIHAWGFSGGDIPMQPLARDRVAALLETCGYGHLVLSNDTAYLDIKGMSLDPGGIGKGLAVDVAYDKLTANGMQNLMVNLGGNLRCHGFARGSKPWVIGVQNPFEREGIVGTMELSGGLATATSGNYERFVEIGDTFYAHIIDPRTGYPVEGMAGVTVVSRRAVEADALSTAFFVLGVEGARRVLKNFPGADVLLIEDKQPLTIWVSRGFKARFTPTDAYRDAVRDL